MSAPAAPRTAAERAALAEAARLRVQVRGLVEAAADNEDKLRRSLARELELMRAATLGELFEAATAGLARSYGLDEVRLVLDDPDHEIRHLLAGAGDRAEDHPAVLFADSLATFAPAVAGRDLPWLGEFRPQPHAALFPGVARLASVALVPMWREGALRAVLCLGSADPRRFGPDLAADFLQRLGTVLAVCLENVANRSRLLRSGLSDFLTGWHNRRYLERRLREELARAARSGATVVAVMMDVDRFKDVNDRYGHLAGDEMLRQVAARVEAHIRASDTAARFGGDEFALLLPDTALDAARQLGVRVQRAMQAPVPLPEGAGAVRLSLSIGIAGIQPGGLTSDLDTQARTLLGAADLALYRAKAGGRDRIVVGDGD